MKFFKSKPERDKDSEVLLTPADAPVSHALILICEKCGKKLSSDDDNPARVLQKTLKEELKSIYGKGTARALLTGCMDICPRDEIAIAFSWSEAKGGGDEFLTLHADDPESAARVLIERIKTERK